MTETDVREKLQENLRAVQTRIVNACNRAGRSPNEITLVAVTKMVSAKIASNLHQLGISDLGESRPQELWRKAALLPNTVRWHLIGHLQRNKIDQTAPLTCLIHSVDSNRLLNALNTWAEKNQRTLDVLIEFNLSGEAAKTGMLIADAAKIVELIRSLPAIRIKGLMTMAALQNAEACRPTFQSLRTLRDELRNKVDSLLPFLSMGMSNDFEVAIEEGATHVRIGSDLFRGITDEILRT